MLADRLLDRPLHPFEELFRRQAGTRLGGTEHGSGLAGAQRILIAQRGALRLAVLEQVFDVLVELFGIVVHVVLPRSRPARFSARNCSTLTLVSLRLSSWAVSRTE